MRLGALFSGGKDSCLAIYEALKFHEVSCLISLVPKSEESRIFHYPNAWLTKVQAEAIGLPIIQVETGDSESEGITSLRKALRQAIKRFKICGIVTGAIRSTYQASRFQRESAKLGLWCFNPLWLMDQSELLNRIVKEGFHAIISGVFAYPLDKSFLGKTIDYEFVRKILEFQKKYGISAAGEGGEIETTVLDAPFFRKRIEVTDYEIHYRENSGIFKVKDLRLISK
ncbi:MAG: diphthine--ammonia ligase [Candidatus Bathyarchaeota archaeon]|nr:diphthine--ammonia ligase [Candidatus Bathyarchaeota archaeon]